jgi:hypothetical protein
MKIDPTDKSPQFPRPAADEAKRNQVQREFNAVLQQTLQESAPQKARVASSIRSVAGPQAPMGMLHRREHAVETQVQKLLDRLENYQKLLGDPAVTLRGIQPAVEQMEKQADSTSALLADMPADHPLSVIVHDAIASIKQEVGRYYSGHYVDD